MGIIDGWHHFVVENVDVEMHPEPVDYPGR